MTLAFIDSGVLINAARGSSPRSPQALDILATDHRRFASSIFVKLEVLPKPICYKQTLEQAFYEIFFEGVSCWADDLEALTQTGFVLAAKYGLSAMDALNVAAAITVKADEFITTEKPSKPMNRVPGLIFINI
jgi:predicted nucleic acid-binding protein